MYIAKYIFISAIAQARNLLSSNSLLSGSIDPETVSAEGTEPAFMVYITQIIFSAGRWNRVLRTR